jgi:hypothetical protein
MASWTNDDLDRIGSTEQLSTYTAPSCWSIAEGML